jgi:hypothetical protein
MFLGTLLNILFHSFFKIYKTSKSFQLVFNNILFVILLTSKKKKNLKNR